MYRLEQQTLCTDTSSDSVYDGKRNKNVHTFNLLCLLYWLTVCITSDNLSFGELHLTLKRCSAQRSLTRYVLVSQETILSQEKRTGTVYYLKGIYNSSKYT